MKIIILGWGSLIWDSRELDIPEKDWHKDGPLLPIEFTRFSSHDRVTLIVDPIASPVQVLWAEKEFNSVDDVINLLKPREGVIHTTTIETDEINPIKSTVTKWLKSKNLPVAIWTGLSYKDGKRPTINEVIEYLQKLVNDGDAAAAEEYIRKAPKQISTEYRKKIENEFDWTPTS